MKKMLRQYWGAMTQSIYSRRLDLRSWDAADLLLHTNRYLVNDGSERA